MKIWTISDIHLKIWQARESYMPFDVPDADVCVVAGDVTDGIVPSLEWMGRCIRPHMPIVAVLGNHEYFGHDIPEGKRTAARLASEMDINLLDDSAVVVDGVRFVGGTLWTDFMLFEDAADGPGFTQRECMAAARHGLVDYDEIWATEASDQRMARQFGTRDALDLHHGTMSFLDRALGDHENGPVVVVTHHAPSPRSVSSAFSHQPTTAAYASDLTSFMLAFQADLWIHGHVHDSFDYHVGRTRVVCNPRGYEAHPNASFDAGLVIHISNHPSPNCSGS
ncbi:metallophosphoesterase [Agrobacterium rubi]|nr:metallophosphoesterase [Agrobacterium rubi]NTF24068.1 metallophosphoesterase [Agrobacterium rubi]